MSLNIGVCLRGGASVRLASAILSIAMLAACAGGSGSHPNRIASITLSPSTASIAVGQTKQITGSATTNSGQTVTGSGATWSSSNTSVATVDQNGVVTAVAAGSATITATVQTGAGAVSGTMTVTVTAAALTSITVAPANASMAAGSTQQFTATGVYSDNSQQTLSGVTWNSTNTNTATISSTGFVTAVAAGSTTISAALNGVTGTTGLTVTSSSGSTSSYVGTQSPGDLWSLSVNDSASNFTATNQSASLTYSGSFSVLPNGFYKTTITSSTDPQLPAGTNGYALEVPGVAIVISLGGGADKPIAAITAGTCPTGTLSSGDLINLGHSTYDSTTSESYAVVNGTQSGANYNFTLDSYLLSGTLRTSVSGPLPNPGTCSNGVITVPNVPAQNGGSSTVTAVSAPNGLYVLDLGRNSLTNTGQGGAVGTTTNISASQVSSAMGLNYLGFVFKRNSTPITTFVGFGPGSGTSITGGSYTALDTDPFNNHGTNITIDLPATNSNGFLQGTVTDSNGTHTPFVAVITNSGGKYFLFGITTDTTTTTPYAILLAQQ